MNMQTETDLDNKQLRELLGAEEYDRLANDESDGDIPTVLVGQKGGNNVFLSFEDKSDVEFLIYQLSSMLAHGDKELAVTLKAEIVKFRDTWD